MSLNVSSTDFAPDMGSQDPVEYDKWFRAKIQAAIDDPSPSIPHDQVMAEMRALIARKAAAKVK